MYFRNKLVASLEKRFEQVLNNDFYKAAAFLDPRFKSFGFIQDNIVLREQALERAKVYISTYFYQNEETIQSIIFNQNNTQSQSVLSPELSDKSSSSTISASTPSKEVSISKASTPTQTPTTPYFLRRRSSSYLSKISSFCSQTENSNRHSIVNELERYYDHHFSFNNEIPFYFYQRYETEFPVISIIAKSLLCIPATSVPAECLFSHCGQIATERRNL